MEGSRKGDHLPDFWRKNYDLGEGLHSGKYKSVEEFLKKQRQKRKQRKKAMLLLLSGFDPANKNE
jgi:hypothetical protein